MPNKKARRTSRTSSGNKIKARARRLARRTRMKIARWTRNQSDPAKEAQGVSRGGWDTSKMRVHLTWLEGLYGA